MLTTLKNAAIPQIAIMGARYLSTFWIKKTERCSGVNIINSGEDGIVERFGRANRPTSEGLNLTIPFVEKIHIVNKREITCNISPQSSVTKDNVQVRISGAVYFKVVNPHKAIYSVWNIEDAITTHAQSSMRAAVGLIELDELFHNRTVLNAEILKSIQPAAMDWGVNILRYEITEVTPDEKVSVAMDSQSIAERKRREISLNADAQRQEDITVSDGKRRAVVNCAEADKCKVILEGEAIKQRTILEAEANLQKVIMAAESEAKSIALIGAALKDNPEAAQFLLASAYLRNVESRVAGSTVFMPNDINDITKLVTTALSIHTNLKR